MQKIFLAPLMALALIFSVTVHAGAQQMNPELPPEIASLIEANTPKVDITGISYENAPDPQMIPALKPFRDRQAQFFYMGRTAELDGWFMMLSDNLVQIVYTSLDGNSLVIGFLMDKTGKNITEQQMVNLRERDPSVNKLFTDKVEDAKKRLERDRGFHELMTNLNLDKPGDKMYAELAQAPAIEVGDNKKAPFLLMVIDPQCPFCKQAYKKLYKDYASKGKLLLRVIPVGILGDDSVRMSSVLLNKANDVALWDKFYANDFAKDSLAGTPTEQGINRYSVNAGLYNRWKMKGTPFFVYRGKDGTIKVLNEAPNDYKAVVGDIAPYQSIDKAAE